jgi:hypothetical protein
VSSVVSSPLDPNFADRVIALADTPTGAVLPPDAEEVVEMLLGALERGEVRAAQRTDDGAWNAVPWVKRGILLGFRVGRVVAMPDEGRADDQDAPARQPVRRIRQARENRSSTRCRRARRR